jgi:hypothetical protein
VAVIRASGKYVCTSLATDGTAACESVQPGSPWAPVGHGQLAGSPEARAGRPSPPDNVIVRAGP